MNSYLVDVVLVQAFITLLIDYLKCLSDCHDDLIRHLLQGIHMRPVKSAQYNEVSIPSVKSVYPSEVSILPSEVSILLMHIPVRVP